MTYFLSRSLATLGAMLCLCLPVSAQTYTWNPASTGIGQIWDTTNTIWSTAGGGGPFDQAFVNGNTTIASLGVSAATTLTLNNSITLNQLTFTTNNMTVATSAAHTLTFDGTTPIVDVGTFTGTINGPLAGTAGLTKNGTGTLILNSATGNMTGGLSLAQGILRAIGIRSLGEAANVVTLAGGTTLQLRYDLGTNYANPITLDGNATINIDRNLSTTATNINADMGFLTITGGQTLTTTMGNGYNLTFTGADFGALAPTLNVTTAPGGLVRIGALSGTAGFTKAGAGRLALATNSTLTGPINVNAGFLQVRTASAAGSGNTITLANGTTLELRNDVATTFTTNVTLSPAATNATIDVNRQGTTTSNLTLTAGTLEVTSGQTLNVTGANGYRLAVASLNVAGSTGVFTLSPNSGVVSGSTTIIGPITSTVGLTKTGPGALTLLADSSGTFSGPVTWTGANPGAIFANATGALGSNTATLSVPALGQLGLGANGVLNAGQTVNVAGFGAVSVTNAAIAAGNQNLTLGTNLIAAENAILGVSSVVTAPGNDFIAGLSSITTPTYYFGTSANVTGQAVTVGTGTPFKGISNDRFDRNLAGTVTANSDFEIRVTPGSTFFLNNGGNPLNVAAAAPVNIAISVADTAATAGTIRVDNRPVTYNVNAVTINSGITLDVRATNAFVGSGAGSPVPTFTFRSGSAFNPSLTPLSVNAPLVFEAGSTTTLDDGDGTNGNVAFAAGGSMTYQNGAIIRLVNLNALRNVPAANFVTAAGTIVRLESAPITNIGILSPAAIYTVQGGNRNQNNSVLTLNGGALVNDNVARTFESAAAFGLRIGANGATIASATAQTFSIGTTANPVPILLDTGVPAAVVNLGSTTSIDGLARAGTVSFAVATPNFAAGTESTGLRFNVVAGTLTVPTGVNNALGTSPTDATLNPFYTVSTGATIDPNAGGISLNANVRMLAGGRLLLNDPNNLAGGVNPTPPGTIELRSGAVVEISNTGALAGANPQAIDAQTGVILRLNAGSITNITSRLGATAAAGAIYRITGADRTLTGNLDLNGGAVITDNGSRRLTIGIANQINVDSGGALFGAATGQTLALSGTTAGQEFSIVGAGNPLTVGSTTAIDGNVLAGTVQISGPGTKTLSVGSINVVAGRLFLSGGGMSYTAGGTGAITVQSGASLESSTGALINGAVNLQAGSTGRWTTGTTPAAASIEGAGSLILGNNSGNNVPFTTGANNLSTTFSGVISQSVTASFNGSLTKAGTGTLTLTGANTYSGPTVVNAGGLLVNGQTGTQSGTGTGSVTVNGTSTFGGSGRAAGNATLADTSVLQAGDGTATGALSLGADLTVANGASIRTTHSDTGNSAVNVTGTFETGTTTINLVVVNDGTLANTTYANRAIVTYGAVGANATPFVSGTPYTNLAPGPFVVTGSGVDLESWSVLMSGTSIVLSFTPVPEPTTMLAVVGLVGVWCGRRRCKK